MAGPEISALVAGFLVVTASISIVRLYSLRLVSTYPAFFFFLLLQIGTTVFSRLTGVQTNVYAYCYIALLGLEWIAYGLVIRELYNSIFSKYPGVAILGKWSVYAALAATLALFGMGIAFTLRNIVQVGTLLLAFEFASHCFLFGFAVLIMVVLVAISKYPLELHKNVLLNCAVFSAILFSEIAELLIDQFTLRHHTAGLNLTMGILGGLCLTVWVLVLSREGQTKILKLRHRYGTGDEERLLGQLSAVNTLLLRAARK